MQRGEIWWAELPKPVGRRPVLILSRNRAVQVREYVTTAEITRTVRRIPTEVPLGPEDGLPKHCVANLDVINTIPKKLLRENITSLNPTQLQAVEAAMKFALDLP